MTAGVGPLSLLLLPKCPLCLVPLLAFLGVAIPASVGLWMLAGALLGIWLLVLLFASRKQPRIRAVAVVAAVVSVGGIVLHSTLLLVSAVLVMTVAGLALSRNCALTHHSRQA